MSAKRCIVIGAGVGGLSSAIYLARAGCKVILYEARSRSGGLASELTCDGFRFDGGPYILLDRPGLDWSFEKLGIPSDQLSLRRIEDIYQVTDQNSETVRFYFDLERTCQEMDASWKGSGTLYRKFVRKTEQIHRDLSPFLFVSHPNPIKLILSGAARHAPFLMSSLQHVLEVSKLPDPITNSIAIWTHIAGQNKASAPSPLAFVPALMHSVGSFYPDGGIGEITKLLTEQAESSGVEVKYDSPVKRVVVSNGKVTGIETANQQFAPADVVVSDCGGLNTYLLLLQSGINPSVRADLEQLPLQSPGISAYIAVRGATTPPYLKFFLPGGDNLCRLLVQPSELSKSSEEWKPVRLIAPMRQAEAEQVGVDGQSEFLQQIMNESWWRNEVGETRLLYSRIPTKWGEEFGLYKDSMNPVMTAKFMRAGRMRHRSPHVEGLFLAGSSTHPGQWVSFCAISGVLCAQQVLKR